MAKRNYLRSEERQLSEVIDRRKEHYLAQVKRTLDALYERMEPRQIEEYERDLSDLSLGAMKGTLEGKVSKRATVRGDPRPKLDFETYVGARNSGMTDEEIKTWFKTDSWRQLSGFHGAYSKYRKKRK